MEFAVVLFFTGIFVNIITVPGLFLLPSTFVLSLIITVNNKKFSKWFAILIGVIAAIIYYAFTSASVKNCIEVDCLFASPSVIFVFASSFAIDALIVSLLGIVIGKKIKAKNKKK